MSIAMKQISAAVKQLIAKGKKAGMPKGIEPMLATLVTEPVADTGWLYEMKWDGYRAIAYLDGAVQLCSRNNKSFNEKFYPLYESLSKWGWA